jgi:hypothetical protein
VPPRAARPRGQQIRCALDERDLAAEPTDRLRHLDADRPAAKHEQPAGHGLHSGHFPVCPDPFERAQPWDRRDHRIRAVRKHDVVGGVADAVHLDDAPTRQSAGAAKQVDDRCSASQRSWPRRSSSRP